MKYLILFSILCSWLMLSTYCYSQHSPQGSLQVGAEQPRKYLPLLKQKRVGLVVNHSALIGDLHLLDFLIKKRVNVVKIFAPEHGFRVEDGIGDKWLEDYIDKTTGVKVISLWAKKGKPTPEQLIDIDVIVFDIQDVGVRYYTYLTNLFLIMEACAENEKQLIVLDRPNPNGDYIAGPVLEREFKSGLGIVPVPAVHGCTMGEMALMINGEKWTEGKVPCSLKVVKVKNYNHSTVYKLPVPPSPNLPNYQSVRLYPSLCLFEATSLSYGRGTEFPFQVIGDTIPLFGFFKWVPEDIPGVAMNPNHKGEICYGLDLRNVDPIPRFTISYFLDCYQKYPSEKDFLVRELHFNLLMGTDRVLKYIREGKTEKQIIESWLPELNKFKEMRRKYLLYPDFE